MPLINSNNKPNIAGPGFFQKRQAILYFLYSFIPLALISGSVLLSLYVQEKSVQMKILKNSERLSVQFTGERIRRDLQTIALDLVILTNHNELYDFVNTASDQSLETLAKEFKVFLETMKVYDQARVLDNNGMEVLRVNFRGGKAIRVPDDQLQDKSHRYYFKEAKLLDRGHFYFSRMDLNVEGGNVEIPIRPMLRIATPVFDRNDQRKGIVVLNFSGRYLIDTIRTLDQEGDSRSMLLNQDGYWMYGADDNGDWAFLYQKRENVDCFKDQCPDVWGEMEKDHAGQFMMNGSFYTYVSIRGPSTNRPEMAKTSAFVLPPIVDGAISWKLVSEVPPEVLAATNNKITMKYIFIYSIIFALLVLGCLVFAWALVERKKAVNQIKAGYSAMESASRMKSEFLANISHELRTPLNPIIGMTDLFLEAGCSPELRPLIMDVRSAADRLLGMVNDLIEISRLESMDIESASVPFNLADVLTSIDTRFRKKTEKKKLSLKIKIADGVPYLLMGDYQLLESLLVKLVDNGLKFTDQGGVDIDVDMSDENADRVDLRFTVTDTGIGIPADRMREIFQDFTQVDGSITRKHGGLGIGLTMVRRQVQVMNGLFWGESEPGKGSAFHVMLPFLKYNGEEPEPTMGNMAAGN